MQFKENSKLFRFFSALLGIVAIAYAINGMVTGRILLAGKYAHGHGVAIRGLGVWIVGGYIVFIGIYFIIYSIWPAKSNQKNLISDPWKRPSQTLYFVKIALAAIFIISFGWAIIHYGTAI